jgi:glyoxylase-like metal-dependent hydrolase (beta-lactamase superfamily II)
MSEPKAVAKEVEAVAKGVHVWTVSDDRIGGAPSTAVAVEESPGQVVVINPVRLEPGALQRLGRVTAILLTGAKHLRSAPHFREATAAPVWAPANADLGDLTADETFSEGNEVPGGLKVIGLPGPSEDESAFHLKRAGGVMIIGDALMNIPAHGGFQVLPPDHNPDVEKTKKSCKKLLDYEFEVMVFGHGEPIRKDARARLEQLLRS